MKKFLTFLTVFLMVFMISTVYADFTGTVDLSSSAQGDLKKGDEFTVVISLKDNTVANDYLEFVSILTYDTENLELLTPKESISSTGWNVFLYSDTLFAYGSCPEGDIDIISLTFRVKEPTALTAFVALSDICVAQGNLVCYFDDLSLSFTIAPEEEKPDENDTVNNSNVNHGEINNGDVNNGNVNSGEMNNGEINNGDINNGEINNGNVNNGKVGNTEITNETVTNTEITNETMNQLNVKQVNITTNEENYHNVSGSSATSSSPSAQNSTTAKSSPVNIPATTQIILQEIPPASNGNNSAPATFEKDLDNATPTVERTSLFPIYILFGFMIMLQFAMLLIFALRKNSSS